MNTAEIRHVNIEELDPNPFQPRTEYPEAELNQLRESILTYGVLEPIIVRRKTGSDRFEIAAGEGRVKAAASAGLKQIPCTIKEMTDEQMIVYALIENLHRKNLNPVEEARGFKTLQEQFGWSQEKIAREFNLTRDIVAQRLRLIGFPIKLQELVSHDTITPTHAEALARLHNDESNLNDVIDRVVHGKLGTKETEQLVGEMLHEKDIHQSILNFVSSKNFLRLFYYVYIQIRYSENKSCPCTFELVRGSDGFECPDPKCGFFIPYDSELDDLMSQVGFFPRDVGEGSKT